MTFYKCMIHGTILDIVHRYYQEVLTFLVEELPCGLKNLACFCSFLKVTLFSWKGNRHGNEIINLENTILRWYLKVSCSWGRQGFSNVFLKPQHLLKWRFGDGEGFGWEVGAFQRPERSLVAQVLRLLPWLGGKSLHGTKNPTYCFRSWYYN